MRRGAFFLIFLAFYAIVIKNAGEGVPTALKKIDFKTWIKAGLGIFALYLLIHYWPSVSRVLGTGLSALTPILFGLIIAYPINILMCFYQRHFFPKSTKKFFANSRKPACLFLSLVTILGIVAAIAVLVAPQLVNCVKMLAAEVPAAIDIVSKKIKDNEWLSRIPVDFLTDFDWKEKVTEHLSTLTSGLGSVVDVAVSAVSSAVSVVANTVLGLIFALYLLWDKKRLLKQADRLSIRYIPEKWRKKIAHILSVLNQSFHRFIVGQCTEAVILGSLCTVGMLILRLPYAAMVGALVAFTAMIPIVGALIGAGVGAFLIFMESPTKALIFLIFIIILQQIEGNLIYPKVVGTTIGVPGIWVFAAVTVGGGVFGIWGMLIGVPIVATIYRLLKEDVNKTELPKEDATVKSE